MRSGTTIGMTHVENPERRGWNWFKSHTIPQALELGRSPVQERRFPWFCTLVRQRVESLQMHAKLASHLDVPVAPVDTSSGFGSVLKSRRKTCRAHRMLTTPEPST